MFKKILVGLSLVMSHLCWATDTYNPANNQLTIPSVDVSGVIYNNVVITVGNVISVGSITQPNSSPKYFPIKSALSDYITKSSQGNYLISGTGLNTDGSSYSISGNMQNSKTASIIGVFESKNFLKTTTASIGTMTFTNIKSGSTVIGSVTYPYSAQSNDYYDANFNPMGGTSSVTMIGKTTNYYSVKQIISTIPDFVKVGDTGTLGTETEYSDSSKSTILSTSTTTYSVKSDSDSSVFVLLTSNTKKSSGVTNTEIDTYKLDLNGNISPYSSSAIDSNGFSMTFTKY